MGSTRSKIAFLTVTDYNFFPGTVATVNSIRKFQPECDVIVVNNLNHALTEPQRGLLSRGRVQLLDSTIFEKDGRHMGPWELKAYAACDLADSYDMIIGIDSDCVLCSNVDDVIQRSLASGKFMGGADGGGVTYDDTYVPYGIAPGTHNAVYMSTSLYFCPTTDRNKAILLRWAACTNEAVFNQRGIYPGHGDQGVLNAVLFASIGPCCVATRIELLKNKTWSQHWTYWDSVVVWEKGSLVNYSAEKETQRSLHCGGAEKFWEQAHRDRVLARNQSQATNYAWWLYLFWFGECRDWSMDPAQYLPEPYHHLWRDLVNFFGPMQKFETGLSLWRVESTGLLNRLMDDIRGCMNFNGSMEDYVESVRTLPAGAKVVEVGSCEGRSIISLALCCLDRDYTFYSVESFTGDLNNTFDGHELPSIERYLQNVKQRFPFLKINPVFERSEDASRLFAAGSVDAVFIDACHSEEAVRNDIQAWLPKLKPGGILFGDDWSWDSVKAGVHAVFPPERVQSSRGGYLWQVQLMN
jgi:SAM-dependent methyltransferase